MANQIGLQVGPDTVIIPIPLDTQDIYDILRRYCYVKNIPWEGQTPQQIGEAVLRTMMQDVADIAAARHRQELLLAESQKIDQTVRNANNLLGD